MRVDLEPAYVLHRRDYRETSLLVEAFTSEAGRVGLVARGARRPRSPLRGLLEPFAPLLLSWTARGELGTLIHAEHAGPALPMPTARTLVGLYVNELVLRLLERHDPHPALFEDYARTLAALSQGAPTEPMLRVFEKRLLAEIGYALALEHEADSGEPVRPERTYRYAPDRGPLPDRGTGGVRVHGETLLALAAEEVDGARVRAEAKRLMRAALAEHLGPAPLRSRVMLESLRGGRGGRAGG